MNNRRKEYSRLRSIIRKRYLRAEEAGFGALPYFDIVRIFQPLKQIADGDIEPLIGEMQRFLVNTPTLKELRQELVNKQAGYLTRGIIVDDIILFERFRDEADDIIRDKIEYNNYLHGEAAVENANSITRAYNLWLSLRTGARL